MTGGAQLAILVNANAKRGGRRVAAQLQRRLPRANVRLTRTKGEIEAWLRTLHHPRCVLSAGGDGTAIALLAAITRVFGDAPYPLVGILPLGTGNGWANALGAPKLDRCVRALAEADGDLPMRRYDVFDVEGTLTHFAGCGYDASILGDYRDMIASARGPATLFTKSMYVYVAAAFFRTAPRLAVLGNPNVIIENLGDEVFTMTADGKLLRLHGVERGAVLYDGPAGCASVATSPEFGYRFKAFPFADRVPGMLNVRIYDRGPIKAVTTIPRLWKGEHPLRGMHDWFTTGARMTFSRQVPLQVGGDACGMRRTVEYRIVPRPVQLLDWRRMI
jgi:diacylglycerol kinase family enzyme